jgi:hypothetical protein
VFPLATADETLGFGPRGFKGNLDDVTKTRWAFAKRLDDVDDRDVILESIAAILVHQRQFQRASGVASLITNPARQAKATAAIAAALSGKTRDD